VTVRIRRIVSGEFRPIHLVFLCPKGANQSLFRGMAPNFCLDMPSKLDVFFHPD